MRMMEITKENVYAAEKVIDTILKCKLDMKNSCDVLRFAAHQIERTASVDVNALQEGFKDIRKYAEN